MKKIYIWLLLLFFATPVFADSTINNLGAGSALSGTEQIPMFQGANPAVTTTPNAIKAYIGGLGSAINITSPPYNASTGAADNATAIQSAINAAESAVVPLYIPSGGSACYKYTAPLTINGNLTVIGDYVSGNWAGTGQINVPGGSPALVGSVLCPTANGSDAIDISGTALQVNVSNVGILFQTTFGQSSTTTGDGWNYIPSAQNQGLSSGQWNNVMVFGHDGNHYGFNFQNPIYGQYTSLSSFGGGLLKVTGNGGSGLNYGDIVFSNLYGQVVVGGTANGVTLSANSLQHMNFLTFIQPGVLVTNLPGVTPVANPPTSAQLIWSEDSFVTGIVKKVTNFASNVGAGIQLGVAAQSNDADWNAATFIGSGSISAPTWAANGIMFGPTTRTFTDSSSSGTVAIEAMAAFPGTHLAAASATTFTEVPTLYLGAPIAGTNATITTPEALYAAGSVKVNGGNLTVVNASGGALFATGNIQLNNSAGARTSELGDGSTTGTVTIGGASNSTLLNSATITTTNLATDATHTDRTVCQDTTSKSLFFGSGTAGVCLGTSSARFKHNITDLDTGLLQIMKLRPVSYEYNADHGDPYHVLYGFTAEDMARALPTLVGKDAEGQPNSADYLGVVPVLVKAVQEQQKEIAAIKAANENKWCVWRFCIGG